MFYGWVDVDLTRYLLMTSAEPIPSRRTSGHVCRLRDIDLSFTY
jgi:hypothetical protein